MCEFLCFWISKKLLICFKFILISTDLMKFQKERAGDTVRSFWLMLLSFLFQHFRVLFHYRSAARKKMRWVLFHLVVSSVVLFSSASSSSFFRDKRWSGTRRASWWGGKGRACWAETRGRHRETACGGAGQARDERQGRARRDKQRGETRRDNQQTKKG